MMAFRIKNLLN